MSANVNIVIIAGNLTRDPQVKFLANERAVANFALAVNRRWKDANGTTQEETTFVDVEAWGRTAELVGQYLTKGRSALVEGRLKLDEWDDKASGQKRNRLKVIAESVQFLGGKGEGGRPDLGSQGSGHAPESAASSAPAPGAADQSALDDDDSEPPF